MPHRLRRVIGVNIRNPRDGGTSMRIAQIDTRGAVVAVGQNGVGKTSFRRRIPVFYGALPSRVLHGSGHTHMIRYVLPHPLCTHCVARGRVVTAVVADHVVPLKDGGARFD